MVVRCWQQGVGGMLLGFALAMGTGCGGGDSGTAPSGDSNTTAKSPSAPSSSSEAVERFDHPTETVKQFLTALKSGNQQRATAMLTVKAQAEMAKSEATIQPPGSPSARFAVTEFEFLGDQQEGAHVLSTWTDTESDGTESTHEIVWILRQDQGGWAVAGFATQVFADQDPLVLSFEDPADLQQKRASVDAEIARRQEPAKPQAATLDR